MVFLFLLNGCVFVVNEAGAWGGSSTLSDITISAVAAFAVVVVAAAITVGAFQAAGFRIATPQTAAIVIFSIAFWDLYAMNALILNNLLNPIGGSEGLPFIALLTGLHAILFALAILQMATGKEMEG